jgi:diguanylate cyclase (GGDEF)-like protein
MNAGDGREDLKTKGQAPEVIAYSDVDSQMGEFARSVALNERILQRLQQYELMLLEASNLPALLDVLVLATAGHFLLGGVSLHLHDPDGRIGELITADLNYGEQLVLERDSFDMQELYGATPEVELLAADDPRALQLSEVDKNMSTALLLPLERDGIMVGSFHWGSPEAGAFTSSVELDFITHLAAIVTICLDNCMNAERLSRLSLLDPLTRLSNQRALDMELRKEISRAQRNQKPMTMILVEVDGLKDIADNYGHLAGDFTIKAIARHIDKMLRRTDYLSRCAPYEFALLLPACSESKGQEIAERMRSDTEFMEIDDGRGANLFASLSIGLVTWSPQNYPAINMEQLAGQMQTAARQGLNRAATAGGNRISMARLTTMLV